MSREQKDRRVRDLAAALVTVVAGVGCGYAVFESGYGAFIAMFFMAPLCGALIGAFAPRVKLLAAIARMIALSLTFGFLVALGAGIGLRVNRRPGEDFDTRPRDILAQTLLVAVFTLPGMGAMYGVRALRAARRATKPLSA